MTEFYVSLHSVNDVREFVSAASMAPVDIDVVSGRYTVNAKSMLGLFSLILDGPALTHDTPKLVRVYGKPEDGEAFRDSIQKFVAEPPTED